MYLYFMKIGFDAKRLFCNFTGLGNYSRTLVKNFKAFYPQHDLHLYTTKAREKQVNREFFNTSNYHLNISTAVIKWLWRSYLMTNQLKRDKVDLYHGLSHELPFKIRNTGIKTVVTIHDLIFKVYPHTYSYFDRKIDDFKFKSSCISADKIIAISEHTKRDVIKHYGINPEKIEVVYQSCDPIYFQESTNEEKRQVLKKYKIKGDYFLYVGSIQERKNLKLIIEAYHSLLPKMNIPLVVVGKGKKYKKEVQEMISQLKLEHLVLWKNELEELWELKALYSGAKALIYPSFYEGFGLPVAEALLCKTPVITSGVSSLPEAGGPNSLYIDPRNHEELAAAMTIVLKNQKMVDEMREKGYWYAKHHFSAKSTTEKILEVYKSLV